MYGLLKEHASLFPTSEEATNELTEGSSAVSDRSSDAAQDGILRLKVQFSTTVFRVPCSSNLLLRHLPRPLNLAISDVVMSIADVPIANGRSERRSIWTFGEMMMEFVDRKSDHVPASTSAQVSASFEFW